MRNRHSFSALFATPLLVVLASCGSQSSAPTRSPSVVDQLVERSEFGARLPPLYLNIQEASPLIEYVVDGVPEFVSGALVVGRVTSVTQGRSFAWTDEGGSEVRSELKFNAKSAMVSTIHIQVAVESAQSRDGSIAAGSELTMGLALNAPVDLKAVTKDLVASEGIVAYLVKSPVFDYDPNLWSVLDDGNFLGVVGPGSSAGFPVLDRIHPGFVAKDLTTDDLLKEPAQLQIVVKVVDGDRIRVG